MSMSMSLTTSPATVRVASVSLLLEDTDASRGMIAWCRVELDGLGTIGGIRLVVHRRGEYGVIYPDRPARRPCVACHRAISWVSLYCDRCGTRQPSRCDYRQLRASGRIQHAFTPTASVHKAIRSAVLRCYKAARHHAERCRHEGRPVEPAYHFRFPSPARPAA